MANYNFSQIILLISLPGSAGQCESAKLGSYQNGNNRDMWLW